MGSVECVTCQVPWRKDVGGAWKGVDVASGCGRWEGGRRGKEGFVGAGEAGFSIVLLYLGGLEV
jgi:hypothetical protein